MINKIYKSGFYYLKSKQKLNTNLLKSWHFFSNPKNLFKITPRHMNFEILSRNFAAM